MPTPLQARAIRVLVAMGRRPASAPMVWREVDQIALSVIRAALGLWGPDDAVTESDVVALETLAAEEGS